VSLKDQIEMFTGGIRLARMVLEERRMARDYTNLPAMLDALEEELDREAANIAAMARGAHERGVSEMVRARDALKAKHAVLDRLKSFADTMEARNTSNAPPDMRLRPTDGNGLSPNSSVEERPPAPFEIKPGEAQ
jgi:hypothetical protein